MDAPIPIFPLLCSSYIIDTLTSRLVWSLYESPIRVFFFHTYGVTDHSVMPYLLNLGLKFNSNLKYLVYTAELGLKCPFIPAVYTVAG